MELPEVLGILRDKPGLLGLDGSFGQTQAFLAGLDAGHHLLFLEGFREWLIVRVDGSRNLGWWPLVLRLAFPGRERPGAAPLSLEEDRYAREFLVDTLREFLELRASPGGPLRIYDAYASWLRNQPTYGPGSPDYLG